MLGNPDCCHQLLAAYVHWRRRRLASLREAPGISDANWVGKFITRRRDAKKEFLFGLPAVLGGRERSLVRDMGESGGGGGGGRRSARGLHGHE